MSPRLPIGQVIVVNLPLLAVSLVIWSAAMGAIDRTNRRRWWTICAAILVIGLVGFAVVIGGLQGLAA